MSPGTACPECGSGWSDGRSRWFTAVGLGSQDDAAARRMATRYRRLGFALAVLSVLWLLSVTRVRLLPPSAEFAVVTLTLGGLVPCVVIVGFWRLLRAQWTQVLAWLTLSAVVSRVGWLVWIEWFVGSGSTFMPSGFAPALVLAVDTAGILIPAATLSLAAAAIWRLGTGVPWSRAAVATVVVAVVVTALNIVWALTFLAANTDGLGWLQPTLSHMLAALRLSWALSGVGLLLLACTLARLTRELARRLG